MSRICPITNEIVLYTECIECDEKICRTDKKQNSSIINADFGVAEDIDEESIAIENENENIV